MPENMVLTSQPGIKLDCLFVFQNEQISLIEILSSLKTPESFLVVQNTGVANYFMKRTSYDFITAIITDFRKHKIHVLGFITVFF